MTAVRASALPDEALLKKYTLAGAYTDCYVADIDGPVSHAVYVAAFYTSWLFKLERFVIAWLVRKPSTDAQARDLAAGLTDKFAAWRVEARSADQLLVCDFLGQTRSWFMVAEAVAGRTRLYFGTAVVPMIDRTTGKARMSFAFTALLGFHKLYSRALLSAARSRLSRIAQRGSEWP